MENSLLKLSFSGISDLNLEELKSLKIFLINIYRSMQYHDNPLTLCYLIDVIIENNIYYHSDKYC